MAEIGPQAAMDTLFVQLEWPSGPVRERASLGIARLLSDPATADAAQAAVYARLNEETLESLSCLLLLAVARAVEEGSYERKAAELRAAVRSPSLLSLVILRDIDRSYNEPPGAPLGHSGSAPPGFEPNDFFLKYVRSFLPPAYDISLDELIEPVGQAIRSQWAFEWERLAEQTGVSMSVRPLDFWLGRSTGDEHYVSVDTPMSEVFRSAYLRALAWAVESTILPVEVAERLAIAAAPVDLGLWRVLPSRRPEWWPRPRSLSDSIDTIPGGTWQAVEGMWQDCVELLSAEPGGGEAEEESVLGYASGLVHAGESAYDLTIRGVFQQTAGPRSPDPNELVEWLDGYVVNGVKALPTPMRFEGQMRADEPREYAREFGDWSIVRAYASGHPLPTPRWQFWRMWRRIWLPAPYLVRPGTTFVATPSGLTVEDPDHGNVAVWSDWVDGLTEKLRDDFPPASGCALSMKLGAVRAFQARTGSTFAWVCTLTTYAREHSYGAYEAYSESRVFGGTHLVRS